MWKKSRTELDAIPDFDQVVMFAVLHLGGDAYGIAIRNEIEVGARTSQLRSHVSSGFQAHQRGVERAQRHQSAGAPARHSFSHGF